MPISDFDPRLIDVFKDASTKEVIFPMEELARANSLRQTFYRLRKAMRLEKHALTEMANRVSVLVIMRIKSSGKEISFANYKTTPLPEEPYDVFMKLYPIGFKYDSLLKEAGYEIPPMPSLE